MKYAPRRACRYCYLRLIRLRGSPYSLAMGFAVGASIGVTPTLPLHTIFIVGLTFLFRANTVAALLAATVISNPCTFAMPYYLAWKIGGMLLPGRVDTEQLNILLCLIKEASFSEGLQIMGRLGPEAVLVLLAGGLVLALPLGIITYFLSIRFIILFRQKQQRKHLLN